MRDREHEDEVEEEIDGRHPAAAIPLGCVASHPAAPLRNVALGPPEVGAVGPRHVVSTASWIASDFHWGEDVAAVRGPPRKLGAARRVVLMVTGCPRTMPGGGWLRGAKLFPDSDVYPGRLGRFGQAPPAPMTALTVVAATLWCKRVPVVVGSTRARTGCAVAASVRIPRIRRGFGNG